MKRFAFTLTLLTLLATYATAQYYPVDTAKLNKAYDALMKKPRTANIEKEYLEAFPTTWMEFYMTYQYINDENYSTKMVKQCNKQIEALFSLKHLNDTTFCEKIVNLTIGLKESCEQTTLFQSYLMGYLLKNDKLVLDYLSKLRKGYQMEFWQFCWSSVTECNWEEHFKTLYKRNKKAFPQLMETSRVAFEYFYNGINYPDHFPHKTESHQRKLYDKCYKTCFDDYKSFSP